jgi:hypothetical protein
MGIAAGYGLDSRYLIPSKNMRCFSPPQGGDQFLGPTQPPIQCVLGALSQAVKQPRLEANHSPLASADVRNVAALPPLLHASSWCDAYLIKHRNNFTFTFYLTIGFRSKMLLKFQCLL